MAKKHGMNKIVFDRIGIIGLPYQEGPNRCLEQ